MPRVRYAENGKFVFKRSGIMDEGPNESDPVNSPDGGFSSPTKIRAAPKQPPSNVKIDHRNEKDARLARASPVPPQLKLED
jgi:hypothetical protein